MSIIYSYPEQGALNADDLLIGTSAEKVGGKQKNITRNFSIQQIADFINSGAGFIDPVASDFQIPVFNQEGKKITGSIMSQDSSPSNGVAGSAITIAGSLVTTGDLTSPGVVTIGGGTNLITLNSETYLKGSLRDSANVLGADKQILLSDQFGYTTWTNYEAGLTYEGTWNAANNTTNGLANSPALIQGVGVSGHFYIVNVEGTTSLGPGLNDWHVGDWAVFLDEGGQPASWQKIDNTSVLTGDGTAGVFAKWTDATTLNNSLMSQAGTNILINGGLKVKDTVEATTTNSNLKLKGNGTGGVEIMSADGVTDGKIQLNCSNNNHGVTLQSPAHGSTVSYTLILPTSFGGAGDVLTSAGANPSQLVWTTPSDTTYDLGSSTDGSNVKLNLDASVGNDSFVTLIGSGVAITQANDAVTFTVPAGDIYTLGSSTDGSNVKLNLDAASGTDSAITLTGAGGLTVAQTGNIVTLTAPADQDTNYFLTAGAKNQNKVPLNLTSSAGTGSTIVNLTEGAGITLTRNSATDITISGSTQGVTSVTSANNNTLTVATTSTTPVITAVTTGGVGTGNNNLTTGDQVQSAIDTALAGTLTFKGTFNAATGLITSGINNGLQLYSGTAGVIAITQGDFYIADTTGSFYGTTVMNVGDEAIALFTVAAAPPGSAIADWSVVPAQSAGVTGSGTGEAISFFSGASGVSSTNLTSNADIVIDSNGYLGLGTSSPLYSLDIDSNSNTPTIQVQDSQSGTFLRLSSDSSLFSSKIESSNDIQFFDGNGSMLMNMTTMAGYVGIGTSATQFPNSKLHINGQWDTSILTLEGNSESARTDYRSNSASTNPYASFGTDLGDFTMDLLYQGNQTSLFNFNKDGRLGIGPYVVPNYTLDVQEGFMTGNDTVVNVQSQDSYNQLQIGAGVNFGSTNYIDSNVALQIKRSSNNVMHIDFDTMYYAPRIGVNTTTPFVSLDIATNDAIKIPVGTNSDRSGIMASNGMLRYNSDALEFEGYSNGAWGAIGGSGASATITSNQTTTNNATTTVFLLGATPNGNSVNFVDVFIDGVYQETTTYSVSGASFDEITFNDPIPSGVTVETKTTADYNVGAAVDTVSLGQSNTTGNVDLRINPIEVTSGQAISGNANSLYIFTATEAQSIATVTLPGSPTAGDSIKISNIGGLANVLGANGNKIMGVAADMTINTPTAAFEIIWSNIAAQGWVIIGNV